MPVGTVRITNLPYTYSLRTAYYRSVSAGPVTPGWDNTTKLKVDWPTTPGPCPSAQGPTAPRRTLPVMYVQRTAAFLSSLYTPLSLVWPSLLSLYGDGERDFHTNTVKLIMEQFLPKVNDGCVDYYRTSGVCVCVCVTATKTTQ